MSSSLFMFILSRTSLPYNNCDKKSLKHNYKCQFVIIVAFVYPEYLTVSMMDECFVQCDILATELVPLNPLSIIRANSHESEERKI